MDVYVYKEYNDEDAYGEEIIKVFAYKAAAVMYLKERVSAHYNVPFDDIPDSDFFNEEEDNFSDTYVSIDEGNSVLFWVVEVQPVLTSAPAVNRHRKFRTELEERIGKARIKIRYDAETGEYVDRKVYDNNGHVVYTTKDYQDAREKLMSLAKA